MVEPIVESQMFSFSSKLFFHKHAISKTTGEVSLYLYVYIGLPHKHEKENFPLKLKWPADKIDREASVLLPRHRNDRDVNDYNLIIMTERAKYNEIAKTYRLANKTLTMALFKRSLRFNDPKKSFIKYIQMASRERYNRGQITEETLEGANTLIKMLVEFQEDVMFSEIDLAWMDRFKLFLKRRNIAGIGKPKRTMKPGTLWRRMKDLKAYLRLASKEPEIHVEQDVVSYPNPRPVDNNTVYLNRDELRRLLIVLRSGQLTETQYNVLKAFLFTCFTSLRISDLYRANAKWMISDSLLMFTQQKNQRKQPKTIRIPLIAMARALVNETSATFFDLPTEQEYNRTLKELAIKAEISKNLTSHVGRHTYGYLYMTSVGNLFGLKEIMGHAKISTTDRYAHLDDEYVLKQVVKIQEGLEDLAQIRMRKVK